MWAVIDTSVYTGHWERGLYAERLDEVISLDIGGTSADIAVVRGGKARLVNEFSPQFGQPIRFPAIDLISNFHFPKDRFSIGVFFDDGRLQGELGRIDRPPLITVGGNSYGKGEQAQKDYGGE